MDLLLSLFCSIIFLHFLSVNSRDSPPLAPALYVFGDSLFDSGNNNLLPTLTRANYLPYGVNFPGGVTGRFTNGRTVADFIAEYLGLPYPPPSISIHGTVLTGLNYASGSCGILPETPRQNFEEEMVHLHVAICGSAYHEAITHLAKNRRILNLDDQIELFKMTVKQNLAKEYGSKKELSAYLSKSIFVFSIGNNDYLNNYLQPHQYNSSHRYTPQQFAQLLVDKLSQGLKVQRSY
ncbi:GDSL esterase/lipase 7 [Vitis vinifera]|uniref:GDSL esterase/lipase 7 n=1 Tax=Vitis vinifera TaxID=29760 RepID=A0A438IMP1_VITVI|nr:GDSL esterase/lipase 7 [Vitis vinifera]